MNKQKLIVIVDSHSLSDYQRCKKRYYYRYPHALVLKERQKALTKGTLWHELMVMYYSAIKAHIKPIETFAEAAAKIHKVDIPFDSEKEENPQMLILRRYGEYIGNYNEKDWNNIVGIENTGDNQTSFSKILYENEAIKFIYEGTIDLIINISGINVWVDHKTQSPRSAYNMYAFTNQFIGYCWATNSNTGIINFTTWSKEISDKTFRRQPISIPPDLIKQWQQETIQWYWNIANSLLSGQFLENRSGCEGKYGVCEFHRICNVISSLGKKHIISTKFKTEERDYTPWNGV
jgi:hypothetical protein